MCFLAGLRKIWPTLPDDGGHNSDSRNFDSTNICCRDINEQTNRTSWAWVKLIGYTIDIIQITPCKRSLKFSYLKYNINVCLHIVNRCWAIITYHLPGAGLSEQSVHTFSRIENHHWASPTLFNYWHSLWCSWKNPPCFNRKFSVSADMFRVTIRMKHTTNVYLLISYNIIT